MELRESSAKEKVYSTKIIFIKKVQRSHTSNLTAHMKTPEKKKQIPKKNRCQKNNQELVL